MFSSRYPVLTVGEALTKPRADDPRIRWVPAWICRNGGCDYRELVDEG